MIHPEDDVARNIRREQQADAMPSKEEVEASHQNYLEGEECSRCGDSRTDKLQVVTPSFPPCPAIQHPPDAHTVLCSDCADDRETFRERGIKQARDQGLTPAIVFYECGNYEFVTTEPYTEDTQVGWDENNDPIYEEREWLPQETPWPTMADVQIECQCGASIDEWVDLRGDKE